jgi:alpha-glucosidase
MIMKLSVFMFSVLISGAYAKTFSLTSPDKTIKVLVTYIDESISYKVTKADTTIIRSSKLGNVLNQADLSHGLKLLSIERSAKNETWNTVWGEFKTIRDHHNRMMIKLAKDGIFMNVEFKAFNDGVAFRYDFPNQNKLKNFEIIDEVSEFKFNKNDEVWWTPAFKDNRYEYLYNKSRVTEVDVIHTPATIEKVNGYTVAIHEARLLDYTSMALKKLGQRNT